MKQTVLEGREALKKEIDKIAEVAGYLWQNGWAERNGGNITVNITELVDDKIKSLPAISDVKQIGVTIASFERIATSFARELVSVCVILHVSLWITEALSVY
jgi:rhamnulose-1-phosphate aldolase